MATKKMVMLLCVLGILPACLGYRAGSLLPKELETVSIPVFGNTTEYSELEIELTKEVRKQFRRRSRLRYVSIESADCVLYGKITAFNRGEVLRQDTSGGDVERQVSYVVNVRFLNMMKDGSVIFEEKGIERGNTYLVKEGETEEEAQERAIVKMAEEIATLILEGW